MAGISLWQLVIVGVIVIMLFGTKKLRGAGSDLGQVIKGFKDATKEKELDKVDEKERTKIN
ncbi:twin-arginine translocase TatA/TatE family subunit [Psychromonas sp. KJ10-2]|uniref:twin-arginine translocase TatA/TatE family subunit n=1 Tax=Psychromonas sp. KJ10-2 TaxID=3391822 RepID=UPI0039B461E8